MSLTLFNGLRKKKKSSPAPESDSMLSALDKSRKLKPINKDYDPELIPALLIEQENLNALLNKIKKKFKKGLFEETNRLIVVFSNQFVGHVTKKQARLYTFLGYVFKSDKAVMAHILGQRRELNAVNSELLSFLNPWIRIDVATAGPEFEFQVSTILNVLEARNAEEKQEVFDYYEDHQAMVEEGVRHPVICKLHHSHKERLKAHEGPDVSELHLAMDNANEYQFREA